MLAAWMTRFWGWVYYRRGGEGEEMEVEVKVEVKAVRGILAGFEEGGGTWMRRYDMIQV